MNYAVIGTGYWGRNHVRVAAELRDEGRIDRLEICDLDETRAADLAATYDIEYTTDWTEVDADVATLAVPSPHHHELALSLLENGTDLLIEKPLALDTDAAWEIVETADAHGRTLGVGHIFRYHPALRDLKRRIERGELGRVKYLHTNRFSFRAPRRTTGVLHSLMVHDIDVYRWLLDRSPETIHCTLDSHLRAGIDETGTLTVDYGSATGVINASWQIPVFGKRRHLVAVGTERTGYIDYLDNTSVRIHDTRVDRSDGGLRAQSEGAITHELAGREPLKAEVEDVIDASEEGTQPLASGRVGARAVELLGLAAESAATGTVVKVP